MQLTNQDGLTGLLGADRIAPEAGTGLSVVSMPLALARSENFLFDEPTERVSRGPIAFRILVQIANGEDIVNGRNRPLARGPLFGGISGKVVLTRLVLQRSRAEADHLSIQSPESMAIASLRKILFSGIVAMPSDP